MRASADSLTHDFKKRFRSSARPCASGMNRQPRLRVPGQCWFRIHLFFSSFYNVTSNRTFYTKKTTCSSSLLQPSLKAFAGPSGPQTLAGYPPAALPLPVYECSSFGKSFLLDTRESKKQGAPLPLCKFPTD